HLRALTRGGSAHAPGVHRAATVCVAPPWPKDQADNPQSHVAARTSGGIHMEDNLVRLLQGSIDEYGVSALARQLGHGDGEIGSALSIVIPTFVSGLAHKALSRGGATEIRSALDSADERLLTDVPATIEEERTRL